MGTFNLEPPGQKHRGQPGLLIDIWSGWAGAHRAEPLTRHLPAHGVRNELGHGTCSRCSETWNCWCVEQRQRSMRPETGFHDRGSDAHLPLMWALHTANCARALTTLVFQGTQCGPP